MRERVASSFHGRLYERTADLSAQLLAQTKRQPKQGVRGSPEPPTLVAKVNMRKGSGELWLAGLPTQQTVAAFVDLRASIQVHAFKHPPDSFQLFDDKPETKGAFIPETRTCCVEMSNPNRRAGDLRKCLPMLVHSLYGGDNVLVHCMTGL